MKRFEKIPTLLVAAGLLSVAMPQYMKASDIDDLNAKVKELSAQVEQLKQQQDAAAAKQPGAPTTVKQGVWRPWTPPSYNAPGPAVNNGPLSASIFGATFTFYGDIDVYGNHMHSSSGHTVNELEDGAILTSRWGFKGVKPVAPGYEMKFDLEGGFNVLNGKFGDSPAAQAATTTIVAPPAGSPAGTQPTATTSVTTYGGRLFNRQAWVGLLTPLGEFRVGRQNSTIQQLGGEIDYAGRNLGGVINYFGVPSRYDSDLSFLSNRFSGVSFQVHYSLAGTAVTNSATGNGNIANIGNQKVWQAMVDYKTGPFTAGYMQIVGAPPAAGTTTAALPYRRSVVYENPYVNYDYGKGKVWFAAVHSNDNGVNGAKFNTGSPLGASGVQSNTTTNTLVTGTLADVNTFYNIYQASVSYIVTDKLVIGGLYGWIRDITNHVKNNHGYNFGAFYDVFKDTHTYVMYDVVKNDAGAGFVQAASGGLLNNFSSANDVNGRTITGIQAGVMYNF
jgi:predicted porin/outer membrane murein-binding lipoprotein Lpp